ncbi:MAG: 50S ribosomal protein L7Ae-like protein [Clostridia bacterium]|jgi:large subunit ribosomal protein L7A|nr:50S ribosomal protein L7Ae-like protein [Clostridia bacterium]
MPLERVKKAKKKTIGTKQTLKAVQKGQAIAVFVARDADDRVIEPLLKLCEEKMLEVVTVESMKELGKACNIDVGAASVAILAE